MVFCKTLFRRGRDGSHSSAKPKKFRSQKFILVYVFRQTLKIPGSNPGWSAVNMLREAVDMNTQTLVFNFLIWLWGQLIGPLDHCIWESKCFFNPHHGFTLLFSNSHNTAQFLFILLCSSAQSP